jgi:cation diffusion facilitator family transporter
MLVLKMGAYWITGSHAILSDAMESVVHIAATAFVVYSVCYAEQPADEDHPYGHGKIEGFSVGFEGGLIIIAGLSIIWEAGRSFFAGGHVVTSLQSGMWLIAISALINVGLGSYLISAGKRLDSAILKADGHHILSDAITSIGVIVGILFVMWTELIWIDSLIAVVVALHLLKTGAELVTEASHSLMDRQDPELLEQVVQTLNRLREKDWSDIHLLRLRRNGCLTHIDFHLVIPGSWTVEKAHHTMDHIEREILTDLGSGGSVLIHLDPELDPDLKVKAEHDKALLQEPFSAQSVTRPVRDPDQEIYRQPQLSS